jgi:hypothetical protein
MASLADLQAERERLKAANAKGQILEAEIRRLKFIIKREIPRALRRMRAETAKQPEATA